MFKSTFFISLLLFNTLSVFADEVECSPASIYSLAEALPKVNLPEFGLNTQLKDGPDFCFDPKKAPELTKEFEELKAKEIFNDANCSNLALITPENHVKLIRFMLKVMSKNPINIYSLVPEKNQKELSLPEMPTLDKYKSKGTIMINDTSIPYKVYQGSQKLTASDVLVIGGVSAAATYLGTVVSKQIYKGDGFADKRKHEMAGALINFAGTGVGYVAIETMGIGEKFGLSKHARKCAVTASGALLLFAAAAGKEAYDKTKPKKHTTDINDFVATVLGGGGGAPFGISCGFNF